MQKEAWRLKDNMKKEIISKRYTWGAKYETDKVKIRWHYQDVPSKCLCCNKDIDYYLIVQDDPIPICENCLKESLRMIEQYKKDSKTDTNPKIHYIKTYKDGEYHYD